MQRRDFLTAAVAGTAALGAGAASAAKPKVAGVETDRAYMVGLLQKITEPVLSNMAKGQLKARFQLEVSPTWDGRNRDFAYMEAFARLIAGVAPWLTLTEDDTAEGRVRRRRRHPAVFADDR